MKREITTSQADYSLYLEDFRDQLAQYRDFMKHLVRDLFDDFIEGQMQELLSATAASH